MNLCCLYGKGYSSGFTPPQASRLLQIGGPHADEGLLESLAENVIFQVVTDWNMIIFYNIFFLVVVVTDLNMIIFNVIFLVMVVTDLNLIIFYFLFLVMVVTD